MNRIGYEIISIALAHRIDCVARFNIKDFESVTEIRLYAF